MRNFLKSMSVLLLTIIISISPTLSAIKSSASPTYKVGDIIEFGSYPQRLNGGIFVVEPIKWIVIDTKYDILYLLSEKILDHQQYNTQYARDVTWETCSLRKWLNEDFYNTAFTEFEKTQICTSHLTQSINNMFGGNKGNDTYDKVFVPSTGEIGSSAYKIATVTEYFISRAGIYGYDKTTLEGIYFTRTNGSSNDMCTYIDDDGGINWYGTTVTDHRGVRPAIKLNTNFKVQSKYNPETDKYSFLNYKDTISKDIYQDIYGGYKGQKLWAIHEKEKHGLCYGFASTTGAILMSHPEITSFANVLGECETISEITKYGTYCFDLNGINTTTFIKYGYATQFSTQATAEYLNCKEIYDAVYDFVNNDGAPVLIALREKVYDSTTDSWSQSKGHEVLGVGISGSNEILVDDSNFSELQTIRFSIDENGNFTNNWSYSAYSWSWGSDYENIPGEGLKDLGRVGLIGYRPSSANLLPYMVEKANAKLDYNGSLPGDDGAHVIFDKIDKEYNLIEVSEPSLKISSNNSDLIEVSNPNNSTGSIDNYESNLYWSKNDSTITAESAPKDNSFISVIGNNSQVAATLSANSKATISTTDTDSNVEIISNSNKEYCIDISSLVNDEDINMTVSGVANGEEIVVSRNENSVEVSGLNDVNATLKVDENTEKRTTFNVDHGDKLTLDFDNENSDIKTDKEFLITVSENNSYRVGDIANLDVTVIGNPSKIRFIDSKNNTTTYTAESSSVKSITDNGDGTFTWSLDINVQDEKETYSVYAKFEEIGWNSESGIVTLTAQPFDDSYHSTEFEVISDGVIYNGMNTLTVKTGMDVSKVQLYKNGNTWTYTNDTATVAEENGVKVWTIKMNFSQLGDQTYYVRTRSRKTAFEVVDTLNLTVYSK